MPKQVTKLEPIKEKMANVCNEIYENTLQLAQLVRRVEDMEDAQKEFKHQKDTLRDKLAELKTSLKINKDEAKRLLKIARKGFPSCHHISL